MKTKKQHPNLLYQIIDVDGENMGLVSTNLTPDILQKEWLKYFHDDNAKVDEINVDVFISLMKEKFPKNDIERAYVEMTINS